MRSISDKWLRGILSVLYEVRPATRTEIETATKLNIASISQALRFLLQQGVVLKSGELESSGGRRREVLQLNPNAAHFVAVDLEGSRVRFARTDLTGAICARWEQDIELGQTLPVAAVSEGIRRVLNNLPRAQSNRVLAVGISHPGIIDSEGRITACNLGWDGVSLAAELSRMIDLPIFLERDERTCILAERTLGRARGAQNWIYALVGNGVGVGMYVDGRHVRGNGQMAGELGHITIEPGVADQCTCGRRGCLESIASAPNIVRQYLERAGEASERPAGSRIFDVFKKARQHDPDALAALDRAARALGLALSYCVNLLSPEMIVLGGEVIADEELVLPTIRDMIARHCLPQIASSLVITTSSLGLDLRLRGAASLAFRRSIADPTLLRKLCWPKGAGSAQRARFPRKKR